MNTTNKSIKRTILYSLSGGVLSAFFVLAAAQQAQAAPGPIAPSAPEKKAAEDRKQVENRKAVDAGPSGRNEQVGKGARVARAKKEAEKKQVEDRKRVDAGPSGRNEQTGKRAREVKAEKKKADDKKQVEDRKRVDAGPSGRNEQTGKRERETRAARKAEEDKKQVENRKRVDAGPSGRNEQVGKGARVARAKKEAEKKQVEDRKRVDAGPSGRNEQTGKRARQARAEALRSQSEPAERKLAKREDGSISPVRIVNASRSTNASLPEADPREEQLRQQARKRLEYANPDSVLPRPPAPSAEEQRQQTAQRLADALRVRPSAADNALNPLRNPRGRATPPQHEAPVTVTSQAPPLTAERREEQLRRQARSRLLFANPDAVPPGPPSPPLPSVGAEEQRKRDAKAEADQYASQGGAPPAPGAMTARQAMDQRRAREERERADAERNKPDGSVAVCLGGHASGAGAGGGFDSCLAFDSRGPAIVNSTHGGPQAGTPGVQGTLSFKGSTANIDELEGRSVYGSASGVVGLGLEGQASVTEDGQNVGDSLGVGVGLDASVGAGIEYSSPYRLFDWSALIPWR